MSARAGAAPTRREALGRAGGAGLLAYTAGLAGCGSSGSRGRLGALPAQARELNLTILRQGLELERQAIAAYTAGIPLLKGRVQQAARRFLDQEISHAGALAALIKQGRGKVSKPRANYTLGQPRSSKEVLGLLHGLEQAQLAFYVKMVPSLTPGSLVAELGSLLANDAQHVAILRGALGLPPLTGAFVTGRP